MQKERGGGGVQKERGREEGCKRRGEGRRGAKGEGERRRGVEGEGEGKMEDVQSRSHTSKFFYRHMDNWSTGCIQWLPQYM